MPRTGDRFVNKDYAETLRTIMGSAQSFYRGSLARKIADDMATNGGVITSTTGQQRDGAQAARRALPRARGVLGAAAGVNGAQMVETLNILDNYLLRPGATTTDADYFHYAIEAWRVRDGGGRIAIEHGLSISQSPRGVARARPPS